MDGPWNTRRSPVYAKNGMVACSQPLAAEAGLSILKQGGNAADAAVAVAAALNVTQPMSTGLGGDAFVLFFDAVKKEVRGINGSGRCSSDHSIEIFERQGYSELKRPNSLSPLFITVPGAAAAWVDTVEQFGSQKLTLNEILTPAINMAEVGFPVAPVCAYYWKESEDLLRNVANGSEILLNGSAPKEGEIMKMPFLAETLRQLAAHKKKGFYEGRVGEAIVDVVRETGGIMNLKDLESHVSTQDQPVHVNYRGVDVYEMPPNGQGITALLALNILEGFTVKEMEHNSPEHLHVVIESLRLAFADTRFYVADPAIESIPVTGLLSKEYAAERKKLINLQQAISDLEHGHPQNFSNTVYFCVVDGQGNACSFINSVYQGFGTGIVPKGCGFTLQNRGANFSLDRNHINSLQPGKRPYHTIIPGMALKDGELYCPFGVMGGFMQPQGHLQVISNMIDFGMNPQEALDAPRVQIDGGKVTGRVLLEDGISEETAQILGQMGHKEPTVERGWNRTDFGTGQIIVRNPKTGVLCAGSDPRNDGHAIGWEMALPESLLRNYEKFQAKNGIPVFLKGGPMDKVLFGITVGACGLDAAVEKQKLVADDEADNEPDDEQNVSSNAPKTIQTPISPVLSNKIFSSGETSKTQDSSNCSVGKGTSDSGPQSTRLIYLNERRQEKPEFKPKPKKMQRARSLKHHSFLSEVPDVRHMERALLGLLDDFHSGKLKAFGSGCTMEHMTDIREQQENLAKLHFDLGASGDDPLNSNNNMLQLVQKLEKLSVSIEKLHSTNSGI
ncbi:Glutathione hydrolase-like YwrD proenzyme [Pseudolycoriella hygida]|uniref:Glutathione hydrolase-like YwrD proenzyme n=1 Tax=Pseudolycoriella hygida TaxID=35572 RepID=A0A9Q0NH67_9DIPT|nr:Glutathione hydrolase-like YwrD proenzyme [Pseudolycoriella hygida]